MTWRQQAGNFDTPINPEHEQEARLVDQARAGSERAFSALLARYQQPVFRLIFYLVGDADEARELARIALKHSLTRMPRVPAGYSVRPWLLRVATLVALDAVREHSESPQELIASLQLPPAPQTTARIIDSDPTLSETMELSITKLEENPELEVADAWNRLPLDVERELVRRLLANLPENDAELLALGVVGQVPTRDLAAISGTSQRSIRRRIARALILFQSHYQMVRQDALPPPPPTKELDPGNISAVMALNVARRGLNEATERMRRSWHNVRASLGSVEAQESLQILRDEDVPTATQSRPLTAPSAPPSAKSAPPVQRPLPPPPAMAATPPQPLPSVEEHGLAPPVAARQPEPPHMTTAAMEATTIDDLAEALQAQSDSAATHHDTELAEKSATAPNAINEEHVRVDEPPAIVPPHDYAMTMPVTNELATATTTIAAPTNVTPEPPATAIRQLPRFGPPAEAAAEFAAASAGGAESLAPATDNALPPAAETHMDEELAVTPPYNEAYGDAPAILMPPASSGLEADVAPYSDDNDAVMFADVNTAITQDASDAAESVSDDTVVVSATATDEGAVAVDEEVADVMSPTAIMTSTSAAESSIEVAADEVAVPLDDAPTDAEPDDDVVATLTDAPLVEAIEASASGPDVAEPAVMATTTVAEDAPAWLDDETDMAVVASVAPTATVEDDHHATTAIVEESAMSLATVADDVAQTATVADDGGIVAETTVSPVDLTPASLASQDNAAAAAPEGATSSDDVLSMEAALTTDEIVAPMTEVVAAHDDSAELVATEPDVVPDDVDEVPMAEAEMATADDDELTTVEAVIAPAGATADVAATAVTDADGSVTTTDISDAPEMAASVAAEVEMAPATDADVTAPEEVLATTAVPREYTQPSDDGAAEAATETTDVATTTFSDDSSSPQAQDAVAAMTPDDELPPHVEAAVTEPTADVTIPYIASQAERTMPVSRHFGDTVVVRDDARLDYVARHQGQPIDLSDLSSIIGAAFSEHAEEPEETLSAARPPAAGVLHIMPEAASAADDRFTVMGQPDLDTTIVAKPIAQPAREEVTAFTQPADLADLVGILSQMTQIRQQPTDDTLPAPSPETKPRRVTRPMPRLDRDAPEPPNEEP